MRRPMANGSSSTTKVANGNTTMSMKQDKPKAPAPEQSTKSVLMLICIFVASALALGYVYFMFPKLDDAERQHVKFPFNIEDAKQLAKVLDRYKDLYYVEVMGGIILAYIL